MASPARTTRRRVVVLAVPALLFAVLLLPGVSAGFSAGGAAPVGGAVASAPGDSFAARAGYDPSLADQVLGGAAATGSMSVVVSFEPSNPQFYDAPAAGAPALTPSEVGQEYGLSPATYAEAEAYFEARGLAVTHAWPDRLSLTLSGSAADMALAFDTSLVAGVYDGRAVIYPASPPALPAALAAEVAGVVGLSSGFTTFSLPLTPTSPASGPSPAQSQGNLITPAIARQIYGASALYNYTATAKYATGETIVLLLWGDGYDPSDLSTFYSNYYASGFPDVTISAYPVDGAPEPSAAALNDPSLAPQELTLDLEWSGSLAPGANLDAVYAPDGPASDGYSPSVSDMTDALSEAVNSISGVDVISMSFGTEEGSGGGLEAAWTNDLAQAMQEHITMLAATGDEGGDSSYPPCSGTPSPEFPAASPDVIAVGGTNPTLQTNPLGQVTGIASESAWSGSGGGFSTVYPDPQWQLVGSAAGPISANGHRGMPDVSAAAADDFVYYNGQTRAGEGTSFATPLWAGLVAEMDAQRGSSLGWIDGALYAIGAAEPGGKIPNALVDITSGSNCLGSAGPGWDTATGWGTPRGVALYADLTASIVNLTISANPSPAAPGGSVSLSVEVTNESSGAPIAGAPVLVSLTADASIGPCEGTFGSAQATTNSSGGVVVSLSIPSCYLGSKAVAAAQVTSDGKYGSTQEVVPVNLLGFLSFLGSLTSPPGDIALYVLIMGAAIAIGVVLGRRRGPTAVTPPRPTAPAGASAPPPPPPPSTGPVADPPMPGPAESPSSEIPVSPVVEGPPPAPSG